MSLSLAIQSLCHGQDWCFRARQMCDEAGLTVEAERAEVETYVRGRIDKLLGIARDISDPLDQPDLKNALVWWYIEAKCEWCQINQRLNYQTMTTGMPDLALMMKGGIGTSVLQAVEDALLSEAEIESLTDLLSAPLEKGEELTEARLLKISDGNAELPRALIEEIQRTFAEFMGYQFTLGAAIAEQRAGSGDGQALESALFRFESLVAQVHEPMGHMNDLRLHEKPMRQMVVRRGMSSGFRAVLSTDLRLNGGLDSASLALIAELFDRWTADLFRFGLEECPDERVRVGKSGQVTVALRVWTDGDRIFLRLKDDGIGLDPAVWQRVALERGIDLEPGHYDFLFELPDLAEEHPRSLGAALGSYGLLERIPGAELSLRSEPHEGCELLLSLPAPRALASKNYVVVRTGSQQYALDSALVATLTSVAPGDLQMSQTRPSCLIHGIKHDAFHLGELLETGPRRMVRPDERATAVAIRVEDQPFAILVDGVESFERGISRPLETAGFETGRFLEGVLNLADGGQCLVVNLPRALGYDAWEPGPEARKRQFENALSLAPERRAS